MITKETIKQKLVDHGYSTSPGLLAETIFAYALDERERCAKLAETFNGCDCGSNVCYDVACFAAGLAKKIREG